MNGLRLGWGLAAALPMFAGCSHAKQTARTDAPPPPAAVAAASQASAPPAGPATSACTSDEQCKTSEICISSRCVPITAELAECRKATTHFDFDSAQLRADDLPALRREARCLAAVKDDRTLVEGNCDERGTAQYNVALGFRRAHAVARYLEDLAVPPARLAEVSYGKEMPICAASTEDCWATNRRADLSRGAQAKDVSDKIRADEQKERASASVGP